jgi:glycosyltransferase involved in cell wall biosynthesis
MASVADDEAVLGFTSQLPQGAVTLAKDVRAAARGVLSNLRAPVRGPWHGRRVPFVWQRHDAFQTAGQGLARRLGCPLVMAVHAIHVDEASGWGVKRPVWGDVLRRGELRLISAGDVIACVSDEVATTVKRALPRRTDDVVVIGSGIDAAHFRRHDDERARIRAAVGLDDDAFVIGWHGSFRRFHGLDVLVAAFARVLRSEPRARLLLVGHGVHRARILEQADALGVRDQVKSPGEVPYAEIPSYLSAMDVGLVLADPHDSFHYSPLKLYEYQSSELPVIASRAGELKQLIDGQQALLVDAGDVDQLEAAIIRLARQRDLGRALASASRKVVEQHTWDSKLSDLVEALRARKLIAR